MARLFLSNCRQAERGAGRPLLILLVLALAACASTGDKETAGWKATDDNVTRQYLVGLREYMSESPDNQAAHRARLETAAEDGDAGPVLEYALALSVDRDNRASLEQARTLFESLLMAPEPLPIALDVLVRLQLGQVIDALERMRTVRDLRTALNIGSGELKTCLAHLHDTQVQREDMRRQLSEVRRKLDALTRIEQTVNHGQDPPREPVNENRRDDSEEDGQETGQEISQEIGENDDAERQPDTARR